MTVNQLALLCRYMYSPLAVGLIPLHQRADVTGVKEQLSDLAADEAHTTCQNVPGSKRRSLARDIQFNAAV